MTAQERIRESRVVLVEWDDSSAVAGWQPQFDPTRLSTWALSAGFVHHEDTNYLTLALNRSHGADGHFCKIPKVAIRKVRDLKRR